ncbi:hypothetical protein MMC14_002812 [Varicellaria rhodocarpa]|nr:hypothetical protein [Varicellaria rhodocarpa]
MSECRKTPPKSIWIRHTQILHIEPAKAACDSCHVRLSLLNFITLILALALVLALAVMLPNKQKQEQEQEQEHHQHLCRVGLDGSGSSFLFDRPTNEMPSNKTVRGVEECGYREINDNGISGTAGCHRNVLAESEPHNGGGIQYCQSAIIDHSDYPGRH